MTNSGVNGKTGEEGDEGGVEDRERGNEKHKMTEEYGKGGSGRENGRGGEEKRRWWMEEGRGG